MEGGVGPPREKLQEKRGTRWAGPRGTCCFRNARFASGCISLERKVTLHCEVPSLFPLWGKARDRARPHPEL